MFSLKALYSEKSGDAPLGTIILDEEVNIDSVLAGRRITLYRYPQDIAPRMNFVAYKKPMTDMPDPGGVVFTPVEDSRETRKAHRKKERALSRKKKKDNDQ